MAKQVEKVIAYITRMRSKKMELLVFDHVGMPEAGLQVPAGTIDPGETASAAVLREVKEEAGLSLVENGRLLGRFAWYRADRDEIHFRNVYHFEINDTIEDTWLHVVGGFGEDHKLQFRFHWLAIDEAPQALAVEQGIYTKRL